MIGESDLRTLDPEDEDEPENPGPPPYMNDAMPTANPRKRHICPFLQLISCFVY